MKLKEGIKISFKKNPLNRGTNGIFLNRPTIIYNDKEYCCSVKFNENTIEISDLIRTEPDSDRIIEHIFRSDKGEVYVEQEISKFKKNRIQYRMNTHSLNYKKFYFKRTAYDRRKTIQAFVVAIIGSLIYLFVNIFTNNWLKTLIADNVYIQAFLIFMSLISIMRLWRPFSIKKGISENDIQQIVDETIQKNKDNEEIERISQF